MCVHGSLQKHQGALFGTLADVTLLILIVFQAPFGCRTAMGKHADPFISFVVVVEHLPGSQQTVGPFPFTRRILHLRVRKILRGVGGILALVGPSPNQWRPCIAFGIRQMARIPVLGAEQQRSTAGHKCEPPVSWRHRKTMQEQSTSNLLRRATACSQKNVQPWRLMLRDGTSLGHIAYIFQQGQNIYTARTTIYVFGFVHDRTVDPPDTSTNTLGSGRFSQSHTSTSAGQRAAGTRSLQLLPTSSTGVHKAIRRQASLSLCASTVTSDLRSACCSRNVTFILLS